MFRSRLKSREIGWNGKILGCIVGCVKKMIISLRFKLIGLINNEPWVNITTKIIASTESLGTLKVELTEIKIIAREVCNGERQISHGLTHDAFFSELIVFRGRTKDCTGEMDVSRKCFRVWRREKGERKTPKQNNNRAASHNHMLLSTAANNGLRISAPSVAVNHSLPSSEWCLPAFVCSHLG